MVSLMGASLLRTSRRLAPPCLLLALCSCASRPLDRKEALDLAAIAPVPRVIWIKVNCPGGDLFGSQKDWRRSVGGIFRDLHVCAAVLTEDDGPADAADMEVVVDLVQGVPGNPRIEAQGALLDFLAWSVVPPLMLWIADVRVDPGAKARVTAAALPGRKEIPLPLGPMESPALRTCELERFPFFSWPTLGAIFVPPFIFMHPNPAHLEASIGDSVRMEVALRIAVIVKKTGLPEQDELLSGLRVEDGVLSFVPTPNLEEMVLRVEPAAPGNGRVHPGPPIRVSIRYEEGKDRSPQTQSLRDLISGQHGEELLLRIEASARHNGMTHRYSILLPASGSDGSGRKKA
jgi:hypothetical protein